MFRGLATALLDKEQFQTTVEKAKDLRPIVEKLITLGKEDNLHRRRQAYSYIEDKKIVHKLFKEIGLRYRERNGGYTRIVRTGLRNGDAAEMALIELV
jgi:large subunit ribosomal protein L17